MKKLNAFTLVELIVVITILAILGTIAFINLQGFSTSARDSKRLSDINNIQKKTAIEVSKGVPLSSLITLVKTNSGLTIDGNNTASSIQGTANFQALKENGDSFKDPITNGDYVLSYSVGGSGTGAYKFTQISTINEEKNQSVVKGNYYKIMPGDSESIIVNSDDYYVIDGGVDLPYLAVAGGGNSVIDWRSLDPNCDIEDIPIGTQVWAGCNSTLGNGFEWGQTDANIGSNSYSGEVLSCYNYDGTINASDPNCAIGNANMASNAKAKIFFNIKQPDLTNVNGDSEYNTIWGKLYTWDALDTDDDNDIDSSDTSGVCPTGRHVPSDAEWEYAEEYLYDELNSGTAPNNCRNATDGWLCDSLGWNSANGTKSRSLANKLKVPLAGFRGIGGSAFGRRGSYTNLWSSTSIGSDAYFKYFHRNYSTVNRTYLSQANGYSVRCIKNNY